MVRFSVSFSLMCVSILLYRIIVIIFKYHYTHNVESYEMVHPVAIVKGLNEISADAYMQISWHFCSSATILQSLIFYVRVFLFGRFNKLFLCVWLFSSISHANETLSMWYHILVYSKLIVDDKTFADFMYISFAPTYFCVFVVFLYSFERPQFNQTEYFKRSTSYECLDIMTERNWGTVICLSIFTCLKCRSD